MDKEMNSVRFKMPILTAACLCLSSVAVVGSHAEGRQPMLHPPTQSAQAPAFRSAVTRVRVDTVVTDGDGNFIDNLTMEDFRLLGDGVVQEITGVQLVRAESGRVTSVGSRSSSEPAPEMWSTATLGAIVYFVDQPSLDQAGYPQLAGAFGDLFEGEGHLAIPRSVFMLGDDGALRQLAPLTTDREALRNAARLVVDAGPSSDSIFDRIGREYDPMMQAALGVLHGLGSGGAQTTVANKIREVVRSADQKAKRDGELTRQRVAYTLRQLTELTHALSVMEGRTGLVWISSGVMVTESGPFGAFAQTVQEVVAADMGSGSLTTWSSPDQRTLELMDTLIEAANSGNVSIYTIDPRPISELGSLGSRASVGNNQVARALRRNIRPAYAELTAPLAEVAISTGGRSFIGWADLDRAFQEQYVDSTQFYMIFYEPPAPQEEGEYHEIQVTVDVPGAEARARPGYRELSASARLRRDVTAALAFPGSVAGRPVPAQAFHRFTSDGSPSILLVIGLPGQEETVLGSWAPAFRTVDAQAGMDEQAIQQLGISRFEVHAIALNSDGELGGQIHTTVSLNAPAGTQPTANPVRFSDYVREMRVAPGVYDVRMFVSEQAGDRIGTARLQVEVPPSQDRWLIADPMLVALDTEAGVLRPLLTSAVRAGRQLATSVQVSGAASPEVALTVRREGVNAPIAAVSLTPLPLAYPGIHEGILPLPSLDPGQYLVELKIVDVAAEQQAVRLLPLQVD